MSPQGDESVTKSQKSQVETKIEPKKTRKGGEEHGAKT